jgi:alkylation response protein AidB-like acyl-CoA dehydrogenase
MNITFTEPIAEHDEIVAAVGGALARLNGLAIVRGLLDGNEAAARAADGALLEFGLSELAAGHDPASRQSARRQLAAIFAALGAQLLAVRYLAAVVHANLRAALDLRDTSAAWPGSIAFWDHATAEAVWPANARKLAMRRDGNAAVIDGALPGVVGDLSEGGLFVPLDHEGESVLLWVGPDSGVLRPRPTLCPSLTLATVAFENTRCAIVARGAQLRTALEEAHCLGMTLLASAQAGAAMACTTMTVSHARERLQFGLPIGSFQAVKHRCADMFIEAQLARSIADGAAADALGRDAAHAAKAFCSDAYRRVTAAAMQLHGGMGITWEHDAHLFFRDAHATAALLGGAAAHRSVLAGRMRSTARHRSEPTG